MTATSRGKDQINVLCHDESQDGFAVFVPHPIDCGLYYQCGECDCALMSCPEQLYFDSTMDVCNWPENVNCEQEIIGIFDILSQYCLNIGQSGYIQQNFELDTLEEWGPLFRISFDLMIYYKVNHDWSSVFAFKGNRGEGNFDKYGDRIPAIFYHQEGYLHFTNAVSGYTNYQINYGIELGKWYHIDILQSQMDGKVNQELIFIFSSYSESLLGLLHCQYQWRGC